MTDKVVIYCDDPSHTDVAVGPIITDPNPALPDDVFIVDEFIGDTIIGDDDYGWVSKSLRYRRDERRWEWDGSRSIVNGDGTVLPPLNYQTKAQQRLRARVHWAKRCRRCGQRGGRWKIADLDAVLDRLVEQGITGVSLRTPGLDEALPLTHGMA